MTTALFAALSVVAFASFAYGLPTGAPDAACASVTASMTGHGSPQLTLSPYNLSGLPLEYTPGATYNCKLGEGNPINASTALKHRSC